MGRDIYLVIHPCHSPSHGSVALAAGSALLARVAWRLWGVWPWGQFGLACLWLRAWLGWALPASFRVSLFLVQFVSSWRLAGRVLITFCWA